jgi:chloramphenicol 3-O-phosphotransferase
MNMSRIDVRPSAIFGGAKKDRGQPKQWITYTQELCPREEDIKAQEEAIWTAVTKGKKPVAEKEAPHLILSLGAPGAGKSTVAAALVKHKTSHPDNYVELDMDSMLNYVPEGAAIREIKDITGRAVPAGFAYGWTDCLNSVIGAAVNVQNRLFEEKYNVVLHSHDQEVLVQAQLRGYTCSLLYVAVSIDTAKRRAGERAFALGRFLGPKATKENFWGWAEPVERMWNRYRARAPWFALWADNLITVANEIDKPPRADDFQVYVTHPPLPPEQDWRAVTNVLYDAVNAAHAECDKLAGKTK